MPEPVQLHNHETTGPVVVVHTKRPEAIGPGNPAHAFGPFEDEDAARAFEATVTDDECYRVILDLIVPP